MPQTTCVADRLTQFKSVLLSGENVPNSVISEIMESYLTDEPVPEKPEALEGQIALAYLLKTEE